MQNARLGAKSYHFMIIVRTHFFFKKSWKVMYTKEEINKILLFWKKIKKLIKMLPTKGGRWSLLHKILLIKQEKILRKTFFSKHFKLSWKRYEKKQIKEICKSIYNFFFLIKISKFQLLWKFQKAWPNMKNQTRLFKRCQITQDRQKPINAGRWLLLITLPTITRI